MKFKSLPLLTLLIMAVLGYAQESGTIVGQLTDKENNGDPLPFANVLISGTTIGTTTDFDGIYEINNVEPGIYTLQFSYLGYENVEIPNVTVVANKVTTVNAPMSASTGVTLQEVTVVTTTRRDSEISVLIQQKKANVIKEAISAEALTRKGIDDAAGAVEQISGVSKQQGSNKVYVRGLGDRYQNTTINGLTVPSNDVEKKNIDLGLFPSDIIQNVSVSKTFSPSLYGDFAAGNVDISSREYAGPGFFSMKFGTGFNTRAIGEWNNFKIHDGVSSFGHWKRFPTTEFSQVIQHGVDPNTQNFPVNSSIGASGGVSFELSEESRLSLFGAASYSNSFGFSEGLEANYSDTPDILFPNVDKYKYSTNATGILNAAYRINSFNKLRFNSIAIADTSSEVGLFGVEGQGFENDLGDTGGFYQYNSLFDQNTIFINQLLGDHKFNENFTLFWGAGYNLVFADQPDRRRITLNISDPNNIRFIANNQFDSQRYFQEIEDDELTGNIGINYKFPSESVLRVGYAGRTKTREFESIRYGYDQRNYNLNSANFPAIELDNLNAIFNLENYVLNLDNDPSNNLFNLAVINPVFSTNDDPVLPGGNNNQNLPGTPENSYDGELTTHAGFVDFLWKISTEWSITPGIRIENFNQSVSYDVINVTPNPATVEFDELEFLPSLNLKYSPNEQTNYRFAFSRTISIPEFKEVAPFVYEDVTQRVGGNPDLLNNLSDIYNFDLKWEYFPNDDELFSASLFAKFISDPVNLIIANDAANTRRYFRTGDQAEVLGMEVELSKNIFKNDESSLKVGANAAYTYTHQDLRQNIDGTFPASFPDRDSDDLEGSSPFIINGDVTYKWNKENYSSTITLSGGYFSDRIFALGSSGRGNQVEKGVPSLNLAWLNKFGNKWELNLKARNILDPEVRIEQEGTNNGTVEIENFRNGASISIGLKYNIL